MTDEERPDDLPPLDPFEAELVAYLDGELDAAAARRIEERLAADPAARAKAAALKKTFDLLDYLPKPEPSPTFTTRTLDKLPVLQSGSLPVPIPSGAQPQGRSGASRSSASSSMPIPLSTSSLAERSDRFRPPRGSWLIALAVFACGAAGYFGAAALRPYLFPARETGADELPLSDHRLIENLPLYSAADDFEFVQKLAEPEFFGDDPAVFDAAKTPMSGGDSDKPSRSVFEALATVLQVPARGTATGDPRTRPATTRHRYRDA